MTRIRTIRDLVFLVPDGTHLIQRGTYFYAEECEETVINCGIAIRIPGRRREGYLFVNEDIEIAPIPDPIGGVDGLIPF